MKCAADSFDRVIDSLKRRFRLLQEAFAKPQAAG